MNILEEIAALNKDGKRIINGEEFVVDFGIMGLDLLIDRIKSDTSDGLSEQTAFWNGCQEIIERNRLYAMASGNVAVAEVEINFVERLIKACLDSQTLKGLAAAERIV